ncbi:MAG: hypothetical protein ABIO29_05490 [Sphingomicrobium sp.]
MSLSSFAIGEAATSSGVAPLPANTTATPRRRRVVSRADSIPAPESR